MSEPSAEGIKAAWTHLGFTRALPKTPDFEAEWQEATELGKTLDAFAAQAVSRLQSRPGASAYDRVAKLCDHYLPDMLDWRDLARDLARLNEQAEAEARAKAIKDALEATYPYSGMLFAELRETIKALAKPSG